MKLCIKEIRISQDKTQEKVAAYLQITRAAYANLENGKRDPDTETILALAKYFSVSIDALFGYNCSGSRCASLNPSLADEEKQLLSNYRRLSAENKTSIQKNIRFFLSEQSEEKEAAKATIA